MRCSRSPNAPKQPPEHPPPALRLPAVVPAVCDEGPGGGPHRLVPAALEVPVGGEVASATMAQRRQGGVGLGSQQALGVLQLVDVQPALSRARPAPRPVLLEPGVPPAPPHRRAQEVVIRAVRVAEVVDNHSAVELPETQPPSDDPRSDHGYGVGEEPVPGTRLGPRRRTVLHAVEKSDAADDAPKVVPLGERQRATDRLSQLDVGRRGAAARRVDDQGTAVVRPPRPVLDVLDARDDEICPGVAERSRPSSPVPSFLGRDPLLRGQPWSAWSRGPKTSTILASVVISRSMSCPVAVSMESSSPGEVGYGAKKKIPLPLVLCDLRF
jgi:hypothetical protein